MWRHKVLKTKKMAIFSHFQAQDGKNYNFDSQIRPSDCGVCTFIEGRAMPVSKNTINFLSSLPISNVLAWKKAQIAKNRPFFHISAGIIYYVINHVTKFLKFWNTDFGCMCYISLERGTKVLFNERKNHLYISIRSWVLLILVIGQYTAPVLKLLM